MHYDYCRKIFDQIQLCDTIYGWPLGSLVKTGIVTNEYLFFVIKKLFFKN